MPMERGDWVHLIPVLFAFSLFLFWAVRRYIQQSRDIRSPLDTVDDEDENISAGASETAKQPPSSPSPVPKESITQMAPAPGPTARPKCRFCEKPLVDESIDVELWEQVSTFWGRLLYTRATRSKIEPGRELYVSGEACRGCSLIAHHAQSERALRTQLEWQEFRVEQDAKQQLWDSVGLVTRVREVREAQAERYDEERLEADRKRTKLRAMKGEP